MNVKLLKQIKEAIRRHPKQFDMAEWFRRDVEAPRCGTTACIAGWALTLQTASKRPIYAYAEASDERDAPAKFNFSNRQYRFGGKRINRMFTNGIPA